MGPPGTLLHPRAAGTHAGVMGEQRRGQDPPPGAPRAHRPRQRPPWQGPHGLRHKWTLGGSICRPSTEQCAGEGSWRLQVFRVSLLILVADNAPPLPACCLWFAGSSAPSLLSWRQIKRQQPYRFSHVGARGPTKRCHPSRELAWRMFAALGPAWVPWGTSGGGCCFHLQDRSSSARPPARPHALASGSIRASRWWPNTLSTPYPRPSRCGRRRAQ